MTTLLRLLPSAFAFRSAASKLLAVTLLALPLTSSVQGAPDDYAALITLTPREDQGLGTLSSYAGVTPVFVEGTETIRIPASEVKELNLVWTFWRHTRPEASEWPSGKNARAVFTVQSATATTLNLRVTVRSGEWSELVSTPEFTLEAGKPTRVELVLPEAAATAPVENIRVIFNSDAKIPELKITEWSVGKIGLTSKADKKP